MRISRFIWLAALGGTAVSCSGILGIQDPVVDGVVFFDGGSSGRPGDGGSSDGFGDGCEKNLANDAENCGACGRSCRGSTCSEGRCVPQALTTTPTLTGAEGLLVHEAGTLWLLRPFALDSVPSAGGTVRNYELYPATFRPTGLAVGAMLVLVSSFGVGSKGYVKGGGSTGGASNLCTGSLGVFADESGALYNAHDDDGNACSSSFHITKKPPTGATIDWDISVSGFGPLMSVSMVTDAVNVYYPSRVGTMGTAGIFAMPRIGGTPSLVVAGSFDNAPLAIDGGKLYSVADSATPDAAVIAIDIASKTKKVLATGERAFHVPALDTERGQLAVDATHVYWTAADGTDMAGMPLGRIARIRKDGTGSRELLADKQKAAYGLAIDQTFVYWSSTDGIKRVAK